MGSCFSTNTNSVNPPAAKVINHDGSLKVYYLPVKVSHVLSTDHPSCFLCNSDMLDYDSYISALGSNESLDLGKLYFVLPITKLEQLLTGSDMASLAVKASSALALSSQKRNQGWKWNSRIKPVVDLGMGDGDGDLDGYMRRFNEDIVWISRTSPVQKKIRRSGSVQGGMKRWSFRARLSTIEEVSV